MYVAQRDQFRIEFASSQVSSFWMSDVRAMLMREALGLPEPEREILAVALQASLRTDLDPEIVESWGSVVRLLTLQALAKLRADRDPTEALESLKTRLFAPRGHFRKPRPPRPEPDERAQNALEHALRTKPTVLDSAHCGCFYCLAMFSPSEIIQWIDTTAVCPSCGIDSVIGNTEDISVDEDLLRAMRAHAFWPIAFDD